MTGRGAHTCPCRRHPSDPQTLRRPDACADGRGRAVCDLQQVRRRLSTPSTPRPRLWFVPCVCSEPCCSRDGPEKEETRWAIFHHYVLHFLMNEIQSVQAASLGDHHLREKITDLTPRNVKTK